MISASDREKAIQLIEEAVQSGAELRKVCERLGITERTYYNWKRQQRKSGSVEDRRPCAVHPEPMNKLSAEERQAIELWDSLRHKSHTRATTTRNENTH